MARDALSRNLRDGVLTLQDGNATAKTLTVVLDTGDLQWTVPLETRVVKDRGALDHTRPGDEQTCSLSYSLVWTQMIGGSTGTGNANEFYEMVTNNAAFFTTTSGTGQQFTLQHEFVVSAPGGTAGNAERITFTKVWSDSVNPQEQSESNVIQFSGTNHTVAPAVVRTA